MEFKLTNEYVPTGDQPNAIRQLVDGLQNNETHQTLLGVTGSGKTFTIANVIAQVNRPALILSHNKTLAAQLYGEFKRFFPENAVEYFISYYDYYQPEAFIPSSNLYIEKDLSINQEIEKLRLHTTSTLISGRRDVIIVSSVSCIYGIGNPEEFSKNRIELRIGDKIPRHQFLYRLVEILYNRTESDFKRGTFRVKGDTVDIFLAYADHAIRIYFFGDEIEAIHWIEPDNGKKIREEENAVIFPANLFVADKDLLHEVIRNIQDDLVRQITMFEQEGRFEEAKRLKSRTEFDLEMMRELGYCRGVENYSRYFDRRQPGGRPFCLLDYLPDDFILIVDESHVTLPQVRAMWGGDRSRKMNLVDYGFRLPSALDNRPLTISEFEQLIRQAIYVSATPDKYELQKSNGVVVEQIIRPTGLLDPEIIVKPSQNQIDDLLEEIDERVQKKERIIVTTLTKRMAEELSKFLLRAKVKSRYIHSEIDTLERIDILHDLRAGVFDVLIGVNLLREGIDLPEVSLVAILDADKEGFLRNERSLIQIIGRAARNENGTVIMYADKITESMRLAIEETRRRRLLQNDYNKKHGITPKTINKAVSAILDANSSGIKRKKQPTSYYIEPQELPLAADPVVGYMSREEIEKLSTLTKKQMEKAARELSFEEAARYRDEYLVLQKRLETLKAKD